MRVLSPPDPETVIDVERHLVDDPDFRLANFSRHPSRSRGGDFGLTANHQAIRPDDTDSENDQRPKPYQDDFLQIHVAAGGRVTATVRAASMRRRVAHDLGLPVSQRVG